MNMPGVKDCPRKSAVVISKNAGKAQERRNMDGRAMAMN
jgi:hypothetical protein